MNKHKITTGCFVAIVILLGLNAFLLNSNADKSAEAADTAFENEKAKVKQEVYEWYFNAAERQYHTSNRVSINVTSVREKASLEVLEVMNTVYIVDEGTKDNGNLTTIMEVPGKGVYTVDLMATEFIIDSERANVLVRAPYPVLENFTILNEELKEPMMFENSIFKGSIKDGVDTGEQIFKEAGEQLRKELSYNQEFITWAEASAETMLINLVKSFNSEVDGLVVEVEFVE